MPHPRQINLRGIVVALIDLSVVFVAVLFAFGLRFDFTFQPEMAAIPPALAAALVCYFPCFMLFGLYRGIYYFSSFSDLLSITKAVFLGALATAAAILFHTQGRFPRSILLLHPILTFLGVCAIRFGIRLAKTHWDLPRPYSGKSRNALIIGAGELAESVLRQMLKTPESGYRPVGLLDDDHTKWGLRLHGFPVLGGIDALDDVLERKQVDEVVIAIGTRRGEIVRRVVEALKDRDGKPELRIAPSLQEMLARPHADVALRPVRPADLLNRDVVRLDRGKIAGVLAGKTVLISGAGGTIGGELSRQVLQYGPAHLVILESHATSLFNIEAELGSGKDGVRITPVLGDIRDRALIDRLFETHKPQVVLHAAAHKHVFQLENNVREGAGNNVLGTFHVASAAKKHSAETFLLVSTDKAVRPTSVMGATKRIAERIVQSLAAGGGRTRFIAVRFGNVLGSSGSVLEIFQKQIKTGGPLTVTHPDVTRYFMTVEEAVELILQACSIAKGGEIFILKMGTPVKIAEMARNLILLSGLDPDKDIEVRFTGLKQGEKMGEELIEDAAGCNASQHPDIMILSGEVSPEADIERKMLDLEIALRGQTEAAVLQRILELAPSFTPAEAHGPGPGAPGTPRLGRTGPQPFDGGES